MVISISISTLCKSACLYLDCTLVFKKIILNNIIKHTAKVADQLLHQDLQNKIYSNFYNQ